MTVTTGTGPAAGTLATITFASAYGAAPGVNLTPTSGVSAGLQYYYNPTSSTFSLKSNNAPAASTTYTYHYAAEQ